MYYYLYMKVLFTSVLTFQISESVVRRLKGEPEPVPKKESLGNYVKYIYIYIYVKSNLKFNCMW